jgi:hypothetical protein
MACPRDVQLARLWSSTVHEARPEKRQIANCRMDNLASCARRRHPQAPNIPEMTRAIIALSSSWGYRFAGWRGNMKETLLRNPFDAVETPGVPKRTVNRAATRSTPVCSHCQSDDIVAQATVQWSNESQEWELASTFRMPAHCNHCNGGCDITWLSLN